MGDIKTGWPLTGNNIKTVENVSLTTNNLMTAVNCQLLSDAYYGEGGFLDGTYLKKHDRESEENYVIRRDISYFLNYVAPTVNSHVDPIFKKDAQREYSKTNFFQEFFENCNVSGSPLPTFMKQAALNSKLFGGCLIVVDNVDKKSDNVEDALKNRAFPYIYIVTPESIVKYEISRVGTLISLQYKETDPNTGTKYIREWTTTGWALYAENDTNTPLSAGEHNLGRVPIVVFRSRPMLPEILIPTSEFIQIARTNKNLFNKCSWEDEILKNQAFSILVYPSKSTDTIVIGTKNALGFDGVNSKFAPAFISPPVDPVTMFAQNKATLIQEIYRMAALSHVTGVEEAKSGIAKQWDFENTNMALSNFTMNCENAEKEIVEIFGLWTKQKVSYTVSYPRDFGILDVTAALDNAQKAVDLGFGSKFKIAVLKKLLPEYFPNIDKKIHDEIIAELEQMAADQAHAEKQMMDNNLNAESANDGKNKDQIDEKDKSVEE